VAGIEIGVRKYIVRLSAQEREHLSDFIRSGKRSAQLLTKARILLKADVSEAGEGWSDGKIAEALDTSVANVERTRRQLVEKGFEAVLTRKYNPNSAPPRIFDGVAEAKLIAAAQFGDAALITQTVQHNADFFLGGILLARRSADVLYDPFRR
jgi:hypothetical protein